MSLHCILSLLYVCSLSGHMGVFVSVSLTVWVQMCVCVYMLQLVCRYSTLIIYACTVCVCVWAPDTCYYPPTLKSTHTVNRKRVMWAKMPPLSFGGGFCVWPPDIQCSASHLTDNPLHAGWCCNYFHHLSFAVTHSDPSNIQGTKALTSAALNTV